jgi:hypothetical protein
LEAIHAQAFAEWALREAQCFRLKEKRKAGPLGQVPSQVIEEQEVVSQS